MSGQSSKWRDEQVLVICPGSQTTMAQLGIHELTVPTHRIPTRMFKDDQTNEYRPYFTYKRKKADALDEWEYVEDRDSVEGAIYPLQGGRIVNMAAFLAFIDHVHGTLTTTFHNTPIILMASPQWTRPDQETITRYIFEKTRTPAFCLLHSAVAAQYGLKWPNMTVVDIGYEKVDITCIYDFSIVSHKHIGFPSPIRDISGGEIFTQKLYSLLKDKGFTYDMAEQLKKSPICEVLPYRSDLPHLMELPTETTVTTSQPAPDAPTVNEAAPVAATFDGENDDMNGAKDTDDGVLDVANIVTSGNTREFLAKREKEKAEKAKSKKHGKGQDPEPAAAKAARLPNSKRTTNTFHYEVLEHEDVQVPIPNGNGVPKVDAVPPPVASDAAATAETTATATETATASDAVKIEPKPAGENGQANGSAEGTTSTEPVKYATERRTKRVRKDIEVGLERFLFANRYEIDRIVDMIYRAIQSIPEMHMRQPCWDSLVFVGNGVRIRGLKENIMQTLNARYLISPSTATIFTSELPSNMATPSGTGSQTPTGSFTGQMPTTSSVNPLLQAATTASLSVPQMQLPGSLPGSHAGGASHHHTHAQTPTSIKLAALPGYLAEWTKNGFEEAMFLGAMIAGRIVYTVHMDAQSAEAQRQSSLHRVDYNEMGPKGIRTHNMMGF
ncbi:actin-like ATPase domain-containing protein [Xylariaceae sp. FL0255]|nr:actin-like ATPase domain-containing protein [Xylariaceae sp. FL0255]